MNKCVLKDEISSAITFDELITYGLSHAHNIVNDMPWSFEYKGLQITHENDDCYIIHSNIKLHRNDILIVTSNGLFRTLSTETFKEEFELI